MDHQLPLIKRHFPELTPERTELLSRLFGLIREWNTRLNLVSRKDVENLEERHLLHSLTAAKLWKPNDGATVLDLGTGGGLPGLPLAILFPECQFTLLDFVTKKTRAVEAMTTELGLRNVEVLTERAENLTTRYDFVFGRAITVLPKFLDWAMPLVRPGDSGQPGNGVFYFKGTRYKEELEGQGISPTSVWPLDELFDLPFFAEKFLLYFVATA